MSTTTNSFGPALDAEVEMHMCLLESSSGIHRNSESCICNYADCQLSLQFRRVFQDKLDFDRILSNVLLAAIPDLRQIITPALSSEYTDKPRPIRGRHKLLLLPAEWSIEPKNSCRAGDPDHEALICLPLLLRALDEHVTPYFPKIGPTFAQNLDAFT